MAETRKTALNQPDFIYTMNIVKNSIFSQLNCVQIGTIQSYDKDSNTCTVTINTLRQYGESNITQYPILQDIPLIVLGGGDGELTFPSPVGSDCILLINDRDIDLWFESGQTTTPNTPRLHDISDAIALVGIRNLINPLIDYDDTATTLRNKNTKIILNETQAQIRTVNSSNVAQSHISLSGKIDIGNTARSLATLIQSFLTVCADITVNSTTHALNQSSIDSFNALKTQFGELLQ